MFKFYNLQLQQHLAYQNTNLPYYPARPLFDLSSRIPVRAATAAESAAAAAADATTATRGYDAATTATDAADASDAAVSRLLLVGPPSVREHTVPPIDSRLAAVRPQIEFILTARSI